jgi:hypothetical protein
MTTETVNVHRDSLVATGVAARGREALSQDSTLIADETLENLLSDYEAATQAFDAASKALIEHLDESSTDTFCDLLEAEERAHDALVLARTRVFFRRCALHAIPDTH